MFRAFVCLLMVRSCAGSIIALASANRASVRSPFRAASATFALKVGVWFRRGRLFMVSPDSLATACPLSGRNSTYRPAQISETTSVAVRVGIGDRRSGEIGASARLVLNQYLLAPGPRQPVSSNAGDRVGRSARRIRDDNAHGAGWPALSQRWTGHRGRKCNRRGERTRCRAAKRDYEFPSPDMDYHATLPRGSCLCNGGTLPRFARTVCGYFTLEVAAQKPTEIRR